MADRGGKARAGRPGAPSDLTLLAQAALGGSSDDRDRFVEACWRYAYAAAIRFRRTHQGAEDSAQDAALAVSGLLDRKPPELKPESVSAFISVVVLRGAHAAAKRQLREASVAGHAAPAREAADSALEVATTEWARRVRDAVSRLPERLRRVVELEYWGDLSTREIARELGRSQSSVMRLLREAETALGDELRGLDDTDDDRGDTTLRQRDRT